MFLCHLNILNFLEASSELQIYGDPEAADIMFTSGANIDVVGINITTQVIMTGAFIPSYFHWLIFPMSVIIYQKDMLYLSLRYLI